VGPPGKHQAAIKLELLTIQFHPTQKKNTRVSFKDKMTKVVGARIRRIQIHLSQGQQ
jgi:hypothetical protein